MEDYVKLRFSGTSPITDIRFMKNPVARYEFYKRILVLVVIFLVVVHMIA